MSAALNYVYQVNHDVIFQKRTAQTKEQKPESIKDHCAMSSITLQVYIIWIIKTITNFLQKDFLVFGQFSIFFELFSLFCRYFKQFASYLQL